MLRNHLRGVTVNYFSHHDMAPTDIADYTSFAKDVRQIAEGSHDLPWLKLGLEYVLLHPEESCEDLNGGVYSFGDKDMRDLVEVVWETLWPQATLPAKENAPVINLAEMSSEEWNKHKQTLE